MTVTGAILRRLNQTLNVRGSEWPVLSLLAAYFFLVIGTTTILKSVNTGLFLGNYPATLLPWVFSAEAIVSALLSLAYTVWIVGKVSRLYEILASVLGLMLFVIMGRLMLLWEQPWVILPLSIGCDALSGILMLQSWALFSDCLHGRQAKRLFSLIGVGGTLGSIAGGWLTAVCVGYMGTENFLLVTVLSLSLLVLLTVLLSTGFMREVREGFGEIKQAGKQSLVSKVSSSLAQMFQSRLLLLLLALMVSVRMSTTLLDYVFQVNLRETFEKNDITAFMGQYFAIANMCTLVVQGLLEQRLLSAYGIGFGLSSNSLALIGGVMFYMLSPSLWTLTGARLLEHLMRQSVYKSSVELVYVPFPSMTRRKIKMVVNGILGLATVPLISLLIWLLADKPFLLALIAFLIAASTVVIALKLKKPYTKKLQDSLHERRLRLEDEFDVDLSEQSYSMAVIEEGLDSRDTESVLFSLELLKELAVPINLERVAYLFHHPLPDIRQAALEVVGLLGDVHHVDMMMLQLQQEKDSQVRQTCLQALRHLGNESLNPLVIPLLQDPDPAVQAESVIFLFTCGGIEGIMTGAETLKKWIASSVPAEMAQSAYIIGHIGARYFRQDLLRLLQCPDALVRHQAIKAAAQTPDPLLIPPLLELLRYPVWAREARYSLEKFNGVAIVQAISRVLRQSPQHLTYVLELIKLLGCFPVVEAVNQLFVLMEEPDVRMKHQTLKSLTYLRKHKNMDMQLFLPQVAYQIQREFRYGYAYNFLLSLIYHNPIHSKRSELLISELKLRLQVIQDMLFRLLALIYNPAQIYKAALNFNSQDPHFRSLSLEVLTYTLPRDLSQMVLPLLDDISLEARVAVARERRFTDDYIGNQWWNSSFILEDPWFKAISEWIRTPENAYTKESPMTQALEKIYLLKKISLFSKLSAEQLQPVADIAHELVVPAQAVIFSQGAPGDAFYMIRSGEVQVERNGKMVAKMGPNHCFGEVEVLSASPRLAALRASEDCELLVISREDFVDLIEEYPDLAKGVLEIMASRVAELLSKI